MKIRSRLCLGFLLIGCIVLPVQALSLDEIELNSHLNEALDAQITLHNLQPGDLETIGLRILPSEDGQDLSPALIRLEVREGVNGHYIALTSRENIREPVLNLTLELSWRGGRLLREYSILLDPKR